MKVVVEVKRPGKPTETIQMDGYKSLVFGRTEDAEIVIPGDGEISRKHMTIILAPPECHVKDHSSNGTYVNGVRYGGGESSSPDVKKAPNGIVQAKLNHGDIIQIGQTRIEVFFEVEVEQKEDETFHGSTIPSGKFSEVLNSPEQKKAFREELSRYSFSSLPPTNEYEAAILVVDLVDSTVQVEKRGDTVFAHQIFSFYKRFKKGVQSEELRFLKCTGDGFLAIYHEMEDAIAVAENFLDEPIDDLTKIRLAGNWGTIKTGPNGDALGSEVHRAFRMEGVTPQDSESTLKLELPKENRLLISKVAFENCTDEIKKRFQYLGNFSLKGFQEKSDLYLRFYP